MRSSNKLNPLRDQVPEQAKSWRDVVPVHPAAELFPMMSEAELRELGEDIKKNGLKSPIIMWSPEARNPRKQNVAAYLLDGRNRLAAMELVGLDTVDDGSLYLDPTIETAVDAFGDHCIKRLYGHVDPYAYAISANIQRRHLTAEQKRDLIAKVLKAKPESSNVQIARQVKVDDKTVAKVRTSLEATSEIPRLEKTVGKDGKERPAHQRCSSTQAIEATKENAGIRIDPSPSINPPEPVAGKAIGFASLSAAWREVEAQWAAGNETRLKDALHRLLKEVSAALAKVRS
jgi:hypothetical protein